MLRIPSIAILAAVLAAIVAAGAAQAQPYDNYVWQFPVVSNISSSADDLKTILQDEVQRILDAGHLAPQHAYMGDEVEEAYYLYAERGRVITTLAWAYPYLTTAQQSSARTYVANELSNANYAPWITTSKYIPSATGARHEVFPCQFVWNWDRWISEDGQYRPTVATLYGLWLWAYRANDWTVVSNNWTAIKTGYSSLSGQANIYGTMCAHIAMARMAQYMNDTTQRDAAINNLNTAFNDGKTFATIESRCSSQTTGYYRFMYRSTRVTDGTYQGWMFLNLTPEVGRYLYDYVRTDTLARTDQGKSRYPLWYALEAQYAVCWTSQESIGIPSEMGGMVFPVERWVRQASADTLRTWLVSAPDGRGDCYWLENLVQGIEAYGTLAWTDVRNGSQGDTTPPAAVSNLATSSPTTTSLTLTWTAPGDDGTTGTAAQYDVRYRTGGAVTTANWSGATQATGEPTPHVAGTGETFVVNGLASNTTFYFALETADEVPNWRRRFQQPLGHHVSQQ